MKKEHEKHVCQALLDVIVKRKKTVIEKIEYPDEKVRNEKAVDALVKTSSQEIVLEHTRIESYTKQIEDWSQIRRLLKPLVAMLNDKLPTPGYYELAVDVGAIKGAKDTQGIQNALIKWIKKNAPLLKLGSPEVAPNHYLKEKPDGVPFEVSLYRWPSNDGKFFIVENAPNKLKTKSKERIKEALEQKCPKLWRAKRNNRISVLLLELNDISLGSHIWAGQALAEEL